MCSTLLPEKVMDKSPSAASALALAGLNAIARHERGHTWFDRGTDIPRLKELRANAAMAMGNTPRLAHSTMASRTAIGI